MEDVPPETPVAQQGADVLVAGEAPMPELFPEKDRGFLPPSPVEWIGILDECVVARIERNFVCFGGHTWTLSVPRGRRNAQWQAGPGAASVSPALHRAVKTSAHAAKQG
jgi:hypothetical protein